MVHNNIVIMNFSHVYEDEEALGQSQYQWIDCTKIRGTDCYLDEQAEKLMKEKMKGYPAEGLHFIDSGNYHYVSKLWTDKVKRPFSLLVFDHHTDMQEGLLFDRISCGSWVKKVLDENRYVNKVILVGVKEELLSQIEDKYRSRIVCYGEHQINEKAGWESFANIHLKEPLYISIDKDVLSKREAVTNWDQGSLRLKDLETLLAYTIANEEIIGIDICGEAAGNEPFLQQRIDDCLNNKVNGELITFLERYEEEYEKVSNH